MCAPFLWALTPMPIFAASAAAASASMQAVQAAANSPGWFESGSLSFAMAANSIGALAAIVTAGIAAYIAIQQKEIAKEQKEISRGKLKLDLFDRRLKVFQATEKFLMNSLPGGPTEHTEFIHLFPEASFLFESEVEAYMREALKKRGEIHTIGLRARANQNLVPAHLIARDTELLSWFQEQLAGGCRHVFAPYLDFSEWR